MRIRLVYLSHCYGGFPSDLLSARVYLHALIQGCDSDVAVIAPWIEECFCQPETPESRARGIARDKIIAARCDEVWLVGPRLSHGMTLEAEACGREWDAIGLPAAEVLRQYRQRIVMEHEQRGELAVLQRLDGEI